MREGIIKINPYRFYPVVSWKTGGVLWGGTKKERPKKDFYEITPSQQDWAFKNINKNVKFEFDDKDYAKIII